MNLYEQHKNSFNQFFLVESRKDQAVKRSENPDFVLWVLKQLRSLVLFNSMSFDSKTYFEFRKAEVEDREIVLSPEVLKKAIQVVVSSIYKSISNDIPENDRYIALDWLILNISKNWHFGDLNFPIRWFFNNNLYNKYKKHELNLEKFFEVFELLYENIESDYLKTLEEFFLIKNTKPEFLTTRNLFDYNMSNFSSQDKFYSEIIDAYYKYEKWKETQINKKKAKEGTKLIFQPNSETPSLYNEWKIVSPTNSDASTYMAMGTKWCTISPHMFKDYSKDGPLIVFIHIGHKVEIVNNSGVKEMVIEKYQYHKHTNQLKDVRDREVDPETRQFLLEMLEFVQKKESQKTGIEK